MEGRFFAWCALIIGWIVALVACNFLLNQFGLTGWRGFVALIPVLIAARFTIQRFLSKDKR